MPRSDTQPATRAETVEGEPYLVSLRPDAFDALRLAHRDGWFPDLEGLEADLRAILPPKAGAPRRLATATSSPDMLAVRLGPDAVAQLSRRYGAALRIEPDIAFRHQAGPMGSRRLADREIGLSAAPTDTPALHFRIVDDEGAPIPGVRLWAEGVGLGTGGQAVSDASGRAILKLETRNPAAVRALNLLPGIGFWPRRLLRPILHPTPPGAAPRLRTLTLRRLEAPFGALPLCASAAMGLDRAPALTLPGARGVRVAVLDPGAARQSFDIADADCSVLVDGWTPAGAPPSPGGALIASAAPGARIEILRLGPAPRASELIDAIGWCLATGIDLLDLGFAAATPCPALSATLARARAGGLVVVAPAGDTGGAVSYPAAEPAVLAVGAASAPGCCPPDAPGAARQALRLADFTARGEDVDLVAPGVGLVLPTSAGPAPLDGTALAAAGVTAFLASLLQTDPALARAPRSRHRAHLLRVALLERCHSHGLSAHEAGAGFPAWDPLMRLDTESDCPIPAMMPDDQALPGNRLAV